MSSYTKKFIALIVLSSTSFLFGQDNQRLAAENGFSEIIIKGYQFENDSVVNQSYLVEEVDSVGRTISFKSYDKNDSLKKANQHNWSIDGNREFVTIKDRFGNLKYSSVTIRDPKKRSIQKFQINKNNDTVIEQLWIRDQNLNDSILYNKRKGMRKVVGTRWNYNKEGQLVSRHKYNPVGGLISQEYYTYKTVDSCTKKFDQKKELVSYRCTEGNKEIWHLFENSVGYRSGIKINSEKGGTRVQTNLENGLISKIKYFSSTGERVAKMDFSYE
jgi:hypothetical protein